MGVRRGLADAGAFLGAIATSIGLFNLAVDAFDLALSPYTRPLYSIFQFGADILAGLMLNIDEWARIKGPPDLFILQILLINLGTRALYVHGASLGAQDVRYRAVADENAGYKRIDELVLNALVAFVPVIALYAIYATPIIWILSPIATVLCILTTTILIAFQKEQTNRFLPLAYVLGATCGAALILLLNQYY